MGTAAPIIVAEMKDWVALGGGNSGIVGDAYHSYGFHVAADELPASDYSRVRDPHGPNGPFVNWDYACAGDFAHSNNEDLRTKHRLVLAKLMQGEFPMICEFIGKPWADKPVVYWARWNGVGVLQNYTGEGHDTWSHISWYRSQVDQPAHLWTPSAPPVYVPQQRRLWPSYMPGNEWFGNINGPSASHGGYYASEQRDVAAIQSRLNALGYSCGTADGIFGSKTIAATVKWQRDNYAAQTSFYGQIWSDDWQRLFTY